MAALRSALEDVSAGNGALVEILGEAGIGKSRLVQALLSEVDVPFYQIRCDEYETLTPYPAVREPTACSSGDGSGDGRALSSGSANLPLPRRTSSRIRFRSAWRTYP